MYNNAHYAHVGLYGVQAIALRQQVKRTIDRFPKDFMSQLHVEEVDALVSQHVIPSRSVLESRDRRSGGLHVKHDLDNAAHPPSSKNTSSIVRCTCQLVVYLQRADNSSGLLRSRPPPL
jgi:hypothetical protein